MIVVFDNACNVCNAYTRFLARHDRQARLEFVPADSTRGREALIAIGESLDDPSTMIAIDRGAALVRSDAVLAAVAALGGGWRGVRLFRLVPRRVRDALYTGFARRRYRWFGRAADCSVCETGARR